VVTPADWIKVELTADQVSSAENRAQMRQQYARQRGFTPKGLGSLDTDTLGCMGELAVSSYEAAELDPDWRWEADVARGHDVAGWQVRCRGRLKHGLPIKAGEVGRYMLVYGHQRPVMWLAGWITAEAGYLIGLPQSYRGHSWREVDPANLYELSEKNGYQRRGETGWLGDQQTPFWHESCDGFHPLSEHRDCDSFLQRIRIERSRRVLNTIYPPT